MEAIKAFKQDQINAEHNHYQQDTITTATATAAAAKLELDYKITVTRGQEEKISNNKTLPLLTESKSSSIPQREQIVSKTNNNNPIVVDLEPDLVCKKVTRNNSYTSINNLERKERNCVIYQKSNNNDQENSTTNLNIDNPFDSTQEYSIKSWNKYLKKVRQQHNNNNNNNYTHYSSNTNNNNNNNNRRRLLLLEVDDCVQIIKTKRRRLKDEIRLSKKEYKNNDNNEENLESLPQKTLFSKKLEPTTIRTKIKSFELLKKSAAVKLKTTTFQKKQQSLLIYLLLIVVLASSSIEIESLEYRVEEENILNVNVRSSSSSPIQLADNQDHFIRAANRTSSDNFFQNKTTTTTNHLHHYQQKHRHRHRRAHHLKNHPNKHYHHNHHNHRRQEREERPRRSDNNDILGLLEGGAAERPVVATRKGFVRGITQKLFTGKNVDAFLGIPYAQPPVGKFRFRHPQPVREWPGELDASRMPNSCYQINDTFFGSNFLGTSIWNANTQLNEDCLYLNIWTPFGTANYTIVPPIQKQQQQQQQQMKQATSQQYVVRNFNQQPAPPMELANSNRPISKRPVLVWIFGGGFYSGTTSLALYDGGILASEEDIIVVSMNYRVSSLGFLYFGRPDAPGNSGLFDQLMALQWIHDNIEQFGGDSNRITIFGESAGAVSISLHMLSPLSRDLFQQAILQSGAATCPWGYMEVGEIISNGLQLAQLLNCPYNKSDLDNVMDCLLKADPMALVAQEIGQSKTVLNFPFVPVVDGSFLLESPAESMAKSNFKPAKVLLGSNFDEGNSWLVYMPEFSHCPSADKPLVQSSSSSQIQDQLSGGAAAAAGSGNGDFNGNNNNNNNQADDSQHLNSSFEASPSSSYYDNQQQFASSREHFHNSISKRESEKIDSFDLLVGRQQQQQQQQQQQITGNNEEQQQKIKTINNNETTTSSTSANANNNNNYQEAKPCKPNENLALTREDFLRLLKDDFLNPYAKYPISKEAIVFEYSNWNNPNDSVSNYDALDKIVGDYYFTCHVNDFAIRYSNAGNAVYMYYFKQHSSISPWPKWMGVLHGDEINFVFGEPLNQMFNYTQKEVELSRRMMRYWANFAKYGNPTKFGENVTIPERERWPEYSDKRQYFELHGDFIRIGRGPRAKQCAFWSSYLPQLLDSFNRQCPAHPSPHQRPSSKLQNTIHPSPFVGAGSSSAALYYPYTGTTSSGNRKGQNSSNYSLQNNPSLLLLVSFLVILLLAILIGLLVYAQRSGKLNLNLSLSSGTAATTTTNGGSNNNNNNARSANDSTSGENNNSRSNNNTNC